MAKVIFNEGDHSYVNEETKKRYTSATTLISKFKQPFDKQAVAKKYALKNGGTAQEWIDKWAKISKEACEKGTTFHKKKEDEILANDAVIKEDSQVSKVNYSYDLRELDDFDYKDIPLGIHTELLVSNHEFELAGQVDYSDFGDIYFDIDDHKTNKRIDKQSFYNPKTGYKMMKFPIQHLMDCNYTHYALQISIYAFIIEQMTGKKARNLSFTHYPPDPLDPSKVSENGIKYPVPYLKNEVLNMIAVHTGKDISQYK